jgi:hypothetical protein
MKNCIGITTWALFAATLIWALLDPERGIATTGIWAAGGSALLGLALCRHASAQAIS